ncbi:MAG: hypothetical protein P8129_09125 [Anaerolineae bacterium]
MEIPGPSRQEWRRLYEAATAFKEAAPWEWMFEDDVFGVQNPETGQIGYGSIMGNAGEHLALALYLGSEGLAGFWQMHQADPDTNAFLLLEIPELQASFEDRSELTSQDRRVIKDLGLKFRGRQAWPQFRSYVPGRMPWYLTPEEARFLAVGLEQALVVARRVYDDPDLLEPSDDEGDEYLVRVPTEEGWTDEWLVPEPVEPPAVPQPGEQRLAQARENLPLVDAALEVDLFPAPQYVKEDDDPRPLLVYSFLMVDGSSGMILGTDVLLARPDYPTMWAEAQAGLLALLERLGGIPEVVAVRDQRLADVLAPVVAGLGARLILSDWLPALDEAREAFEGFLD